MSIQPIHPSTYYMGASVSESQGSTPPPSQSEENHLSQTLEVVSSGLKGPLTIEPIYFSPVTQGPLDPVDSN